MGDGSARAAFLIVEEALISPLNLSVLSQQTVISIQNKRRVRATE
jgi:hypothetical protein